MRVSDERNGELFSYVDIEERIPPTRLLRALLLQAFDTIRSERQLMEHLLGLGGALAVAY